MRQISKHPPLKQCILYCYITFLDQRLAVEAVLLKEVAPDPKPRT